MTIRQSGITKENFYEYVKFEILYENIPKNYASIMEDLIMKLYREIGNCNLWNEINGVYHKKESQEKYRKSEKGMKKQQKWKEDNKEKLKEYFRRKYQEKT